MASARKAPPTGGVRFAPSPTGRFHLGNLRTAWISYQCARHLHLPWMVRFEDIDTVRVIPGAREQQLADMAALGLVPDMTHLQTDYRLRHWSLFERGVRAGVLYPCDCSRKDVQAAIASAPHDGLAPVYSGHCRALSSREMRAVDSIAWRFRMSETSGREDFIIARSGAALKDGLPSLESFVPAYHWACAIDDFDGRYEILVRSSDLKSALPLQRALQAWLGEMEGAWLPSVMHTALVVQDDGHRLEKRTQGVTLPELAQRGVSPEKLVEIFAASFDPVSLPASPATGREYGEKTERLTLSELRIRP